MKIIKRVISRLENHELAQAILIKLVKILGRLYSRSEIFMNDFICHEKIAKIYTFHRFKSSQVNEKLLHDHINMWKVLEPRINTKWMEAYTHISNIESAKYVPEDIYYQKVEPCLNYIPMLKAFSDKNLYDRDVIKDFVPKTFVRKIDGVFYDKQYNPVIGEEYLKAITTDYDEVIVKPTINTAGGKGVELFKRDNNVFINQQGNELTVNYLDTAFGENYIVQEKIIEHESLSKFNPSSVNTIRLYTYRSVVNENIIAINAVLRVGTPNSVVDNWGAGGLSVGMDQNGVLNNFAVDKIGNKFDCVGDIDLRTPNRIIYLKDMSDVAIRVARTHYYARVLGFDMTVDANSNVRILEVNNKSIGINVIQMNNGPLFKDYTEEIIEYCLKNRKN